MGDDAVQWVGIDHVQLAMPPGEEAVAEAFYGGALGLTMVPKPEPLASRGGRWFRCDAFEVHLGVEDGFRPARKAHPALVVADLDRLADRLRAAGADVVDDHEIPERRRAFVHDPFGNRIELVEG